MPLTREPRNQNIYTDEVDQKGGYTARVRDKEARAAAKEAAETAKADLDAYKETNDAAVAELDDRLDQAELDIDAAQESADNAQESANNAQADAQAAQATADSVDNSLKTYVRPNLLENWYFVGGGSQQGYGYFPLNSNGQTVYSGAIVGIDRWSGTNGNVNVVVATDYIRLYGTNGANVWLRNYGDGNSIYGKQITISMLLDDGTLLTKSGVLPTASVSSTTGFATDAHNGVTFGLYKEPSGIWFAQIGNTGGGNADIVATKLEIGSTQTLAHQENGAWVLNEVPSYGEEFSETVLSRAPYYYEDFTTTSRTSAWGGWYRGTADKYIGDRLPKLRAMFIIKAQDNIPAMVFLDNSSSYAYLVNAQAGRQMTARFVFER